MTIENLDRFFNILIDSINTVESPYIRTVYDEMGIVAQMLSYYERRNLRGNDLVRTGERIFCYELYYQLRVRMINEVPQIFNNVFLQGELRKHQIEPLIRRFGLRRLSQGFIPDLLLHTPGNANDHPYVIEIKNNRFLEERELFEDIDKISEFICSYNYQRGVFIGVSISLNSLINLIKESKQISKIPNIHEIKDRIIIIARESENTQADHINLSKII